MNLPNLPRLYAIQGGANSLCMPRNAPPGRVHQDNDGHPPVRQILLVSDVLVGREQNIETGLLRTVQQVAVFQTVPAVLRRQFDLMADKPTA